MTSETNQTPGRIAENYLGIAGELEESRITAFMTLAPQLAVERLVVRYDDKSDDPIRSFFAPTLLRRENDTPTLHLLPEFGGMVDGRLSFVPYRSQGGKKSRHGVFFGNLTSSSQLDVAVKPFAKIEGLVAEEACFADFFCNTLANNLGLGSLRAVGVITGPGESLYSLTLLERALDTFDSLDWTDFGTALDKNPGMSGLWIKAAHSIAVLHSTGDSNHGDLFPRNIATYPEGQVVLIDWESSHINTHSHRDLEARFGGHLTDLRQLIEGMAYPPDLKAPGCGMFLKLHSDWWDVFDAIFFSEYREWRINLASEGNHHMKKLAETQEELAQLEASLKAELETIRALYQPNKKDPDLSAS